jgi:hypothetical protein
MREWNKVLEQFHYFNIQAEVDSVYGNWAVSKEGDVVNCVYPYAVLSIHINDVDWVARIRTKVWFKPESEEDFKKALKRAKTLTSKRDVK